LVRKKSIQKWEHNIELSMTTQQSTVLPVDIGL
jgi:hypothetical protein